MRFCVRGSRGSVPVPGPDTVRYGGNTTCIEVRSDAGDLIVLDAGTGIRGLGLELADSMPITGHVFITHTHWDHIQGLPFFIPLFVAGNAISLYGPPDPLGMTGIETVLDKQLQYPYFPVRATELLADISYHTLNDRQSVDLGFAQVEALLMNHPALNYGYKIHCDGKTLFFTGDHEPFYNIYDSNDEEYVDYEKVVAERHQILVEFVRDVDVLIADAQYTDEEYKTRLGWGHSTFERSLDLARQAGVGCVYLTHHDATRTDRDIDVLFAGYTAQWREQEFEFHMAREGLLVEL